MSRDKISAGAIYYALGTLLWFPFILAGAALFLVAAFPSTEASLKQRLRAFSLARATRFVAFSLSVIILVYGLAIFAARISSVTEAGEWYAKAGHGHSQSIKAVRILTGLPRSFLYLGKDGILYRRYLRHDPYAPVSIVNIATASLWKLVVFDLSVVCLLYALCRRNSPKWPLLLLLAGAGPVIFFAVVIFEPGSPERYLPALPFLVVVSAWILRDFQRTRRLPQIVIASFLACTILANGYSFASPRVSAEDSASLQRVSELRTRLSPGSVVVVTTNQDALEETLNRSAFSNINRPDPIQLYDTIEPGTLRLPQWKQELSARMLTAWRSGGDVWLSKRLWSPQPLPAWNWVEGDDQRITWKELPPFFSGLATDAEAGGADGFARLARINGNLRLISGLAAESEKSGTRD